MSYVPPHLRDRSLPSTHQATPIGARTRLPDPSQPGPGQSRNPPPSSHNTGSYGLGASRHAYGSFKAPSPRPSRRYDNGSVLESNPNDIKPRRRNVDANTSRSNEDQGSLADRLTTEMELLGTVSRSGGVGDENDAYVRHRFHRPDTRVDTRGVAFLHGYSLKDFAIQQKYRKWIQAKLDDYEKRFPEYHSVQIDATAKEALEIMNNILIYFPAEILDLGKLREGLIASRRLDEFAIEVYETSALYAIKARNHPQIISSLSVLVPNAYTVAARSQRTTTDAQAALSERLQKLDMKDSANEGPKLAQPDRRGLFTSLLLLYDIVYRQSQRDFMTRFFSLTDPEISSQGRRRRRRGEHNSPEPVFISAHDPHMRYAWDVQQAISQTSALRFDAVSQPTVRLRRTSNSTSSQQDIYVTDPHQRIILSWATETIRQQVWDIAQKAYHPQLGLGLEWCARLLLFSPETNKRDAGVDDVEGRDSIVDMRQWITSHGGRVENAKVFPT
ncbi:hypothetical protein QFC22_000350 [Naganishia vaughanmartiniae]|uniref:Uncharacterized protein n=1 Tax=Naganishia vaughanmartiniae TaxID=1424756 RepID=A0ACC2XP40_9TREE|nr:hypothetical protein QFC22_000350 [Naganishia vaughanmartiniae]